jgi:hypothetical protein
MHLVSGECRPALVLYRLCRAWLKRRAGAAAKVPSGKTQVTKTPQSALTITTCVMISFSDTELTSDLAAADLDPEKWSVFLERIGAMLSMRGRQFDYVSKSARTGLVHEPRMAKKLKL